MTATSLVFGLTVLLALACEAARGADLKLPDKVTGNPGTFVKVPATTTGTVVRWYALDSGLNLFPVELLKDTKTAVVTGPAGTYRLLAYTSDKDGPSDPAVCVVVLGDPPPPPGPPPPTDPFTQALAAAYAKEADPGKAQQVAFLAAVYQGAGTLLTPNMTAGDLFGKLSTAIHAPAVGIPKGALPSVSKVIGDDLNAVLGTNATTAVDPAKAKAAFAKYAAALGTLK